MKFGVREICDVTFKTTTAGQKIGKTVFEKAGMPAFMIDTARTSSLEQASTTVYAQGGRGYNRLIAWEGEKTMTFTVEDALISPMGLAVLSGAGLINPSMANVAHVHMTIDKFVDANGATEVTLDDLREETGLELATVFNVCKSTAVPAYATVLDGSGAGIEFKPNVTITGTASATASDTVEVKENQPATFTVADCANKTVKLDFYLIMSQGVTEIEIKPEDFGGFFYVEAETLFRREDTGKDMAATIIIPKAKVQSAFTFTMAASGDPSTFTFTMDAFPGYTMFDKTKKVMCVMQVIGTDDTSVSADEAHEHEVTADTPSFHKPDTPSPSIDIENSAAVDGTAAPAGFPDAAEYQANQGKLTVTVTGDDINVKVAGGVAALDTWTSTDPYQATFGDKPWIALDIDTGANDITQVKYNGDFLTQQDVDDATAWGLGAGHFILWLKADDVKITPKQFTLEGANLVNVEITVEDAA